jgi:regulator of protease activity HflC (stomatin/prohibitin superfamily)
VATLLEILRELLLALPLPLASAVLGTAAIGGFLWLATFSRSNIWILSRTWFITAVRCVLVFLMLELNLVPRLLAWWMDDLLTIFRESQGMTQLLILMVWMLFPFGVLGGVAILLRAQDWVFNLVRESPLIVWKSRRILVFGTFGAFVLCVFLKVLGASGSIVLFFVAAATSLALVSPSLSAEPTHRTFRRWALPAVWLYYWGIAGIALRYSWTGLILVAIPTLLITGAWLFLAAGSLFPLPVPDLHRGSRTPRKMGSIPIVEEQFQDFVDMLRYPQNRAARRQWFAQRRVAVRCLVTYALGTNYSYYTVIDEKIRYRTEGERAWLTAEERVVKRVGGDPFGDFMAGPGIVLTGCDHAVVISSGTQFKGAKGPGTVFIQYADAPAQAIDLRPHLCAFQVEAWTKDGIAVKVLTFIPFQIETGNETPVLGKGYPYHASAVYKAVQAQLMVHETASQMPEDVKPQLWYDIPRTLAEPIMRELVSRYEFDQLYAPFDLYDDFSEHPRARIVTELQEMLDAELETRGIQRVGGGIGNIVPVDEEVLAQRVRAWRAKWISEIMQRQARGQSTRLRLVERARAQAQTDIILSIGNRMKQIRDGGGDERLDAVLSYFTEVLEQLSGRKELRQLLPRDMDAILEALRTAASDSVPVGEERE